MRVRALDTNGDWTFGNGLNNYLVENEAIKQNTVTRIKSFKNDWFLDTQANIDWFNILGQLNNEDTIKEELIRVILNTDGVTRVNNIDIITDEKRNATFTIDLSTIYSDNELIGVTI